MTIHEGRELVPVNELDFQADRFAISLSIPDYVKGGRPCVDMVALRRAMDFARVHSLKILNEADKEDLGIGDINGDGSASAADSRRIKKPVELSRFSKNVGPPHRSFASQVWSNCVVKHDLEDVKREIGNNDGIYDANAWASELDGVLRSAIIRASYSSLAWSSKLDISACFISTLINTPFFALAASPDEPHLSIPLFAAVHASVLIASVDLIPHILDSDGTIKPRLVSFVGFDLARLALAYPLSNRLTFCTVAQDLDDEG